MNYIISFIDNTTSAYADNYLQSNNIIMLEHLQNLGQLYVTQSDSVPPPDNRIDYIVENDLTKITLMSNDCSPIQTDNDENWWKLSTINITNFESPTITHCKNITPVNVYVMDSGLAADHEEFVGVNVENVFSYDGTFNDDNGHGTAISSLIAGKTLSLSNANLKVVKILGSTPTYLIDLLRALNAIIGSAKTSDAISIVNMSWIIPKFTFFEKQVEKLFANNILVVCAAGNSNMDVEMVSPASMENALCVGAYDENFRPCNYIGYAGNPSTEQAWSNHGAVDVWAPGLNLKVANFTGGYSVSGGTSLACAIHASSVAYALGDYYNVGSVPIQKNFNYYMSVASSLSAYNFGLIDFSETYGQYLNISNARTSTVKSQIDQATDVLISAVQNKFFVRNNALTFLKCILTSSVTDVTVTGLPNGLSLTDGWLIGKPVVEFPVPTETEPPVTELLFDATIQFTAVNQTTQYTLPIIISVRKV